MKKYKKIIIVILMVVLIITACVLYITKSKNNKSINSTINQKIEVRDDIDVEKINDVKKLYNLEDVINSIIEKSHDTLLDKEDDAIMMNFANSMQEFSSEELKVFNIEKAYEVDYGNDLVFYFTEGYVMYDDIKEAPEGNINKHSVKLVLYRNKQNDHYTLEKYGNENQLFFVFNEDIAKTAIKRDISTDIIVCLKEEMIYSEDSIEKEVKESNIIIWYYNDYKNKKLFETQNREDYEKGEVHSIKKNNNNEYLITTDDGKEVTLKPGNDGREYSIL